MFSKPKEPPPPPMVPRPAGTSAQVAGEQAVKGMTSTVVTTPKGLVDPAPTRKRSIIGGAP